jgi:hypothetical protein
VIVIRQDGRELWRMDVGAALSPYHLNLQVGPNHGTIEFATDTPGIPESPAPNARPLAFALYDVRVSLTQK